MLTLLREMLHSPVLDIVQRLKHSTGMTVTELCTAMKMSYMGVKQHCVELEKAGFLDTWRRPKAAGRPEKLYRLTDKANALFLNCGSPLTLDLLATAERVYGESAPPKLLYTYFQSKGGFSEGSPDDLPPARREKYDAGGRNSKVLVKKLGTEAAPGAPPTKPVLAMVECSCHSSSNSRPRFYKISTLKTMH